MRRLLTLDVGKHPLTRAIIIAAVTLFVGSALMVPGLNPVTRGWVLGGMETASILGAGWGELNYTRQLAAEHVQVYGTWPETLSEFGGWRQGGIFDIQSPQAYVLEARLKPVGNLDADMVGTGVVFTIDPDTLRWSCRGAEPPLPGRYLPDDCREPGYWTTATWLSAIAIGALVVVLALGIWMLVNNPLIGPLQRDPQRLKRLPVDQLHRADRALGWLRRRRLTLRAARVTQADWQDALKYTRLDVPGRCALLALRLAARSEASAGWDLPGAVFEWRFPADLPVNLERILVYVPPADLSGADIVRHLRRLSTGMDVMLVMSVEADTEAVVARFTADTVNLFAQVTLEDQTEWLLAAQPVTVLLRSLATQLRVTRISPYQTRGGVSRPSAFFGRETVLSRIINRPPANYLIVGGRQLGKTSVLKAIERRMVDHPRIACHYVSLRDHRLTPRLAMQFGLPPTSALDVVVAELARQQTDKHLLLLIDEADLFFRHEAGQGYPELTTLRALSDEGRCHFILAGFWDLYATAVLDYQSPLRNFGEVITVGGLEHDACRALATDPLALLGLSFETPALVDDLVMLSGRRANLVAILCQECLEVLGGGERTIRAEHLAQARRAQAVQDALSGWGRLTSEAADARLDRIIVYQTALEGRATVARTVDTLTQAGVAFDIEAVRRAFARLQLAFVLDKRADGYRFSVPLFTEHFDPSEVPLFLRQELGGD